MTEVAIRVENLGKRYRLGLTHDDLFANKLVNGAKRLLGRAEKAEAEDLWALKDVSFEIKRGDVVGIIGRNGAGKSTLLKILSRITTPTTGRVELNGRVASLLEVGTGFHPELTGRENIYLNGAILGMTRGEITSKFDEIVDFAEIEKFIDTPVKRYSSGMYVRLAFAVAAHLEPEILLVDEVLAVGDIQFQQKCLGKMGEVAKVGRTVLFVSHNMRAISHLCPFSALFEAGEIRYQGDSDVAVGKHLQRSFRCHTKLQWENPKPQTDGNELTLQSIALTDETGTVLEIVSTAQDFHVRLRYKLRKKLTRCCLGIILAAASGEIVFQSYDTDGKVALPERREGTYRSTCLIPAKLLNAGTYMIRVYAEQAGTKVLVRTDYVLQFAVQDIGTTGFLALPKRSGTVRPKLEWKVGLVENDD